MTAERGYPLCPEHRNWTQVSPFPGRTYPLDMREVIAMQGQIHAPALPSGLRRAHGSREEPYPPAQYFEGLAWTGGAE